MSGHPLNRTALEQAAVGHRRPANRRGLTFACDVDNGPTLPSGRANAEDWNMINRIAMVTLALAAGVLCTAWSSWERMDPEDGRIGLTRDGDEWVAEGYGNSMDRISGHVFRVEDGWWGYEDRRSSRVEIKFYWAETSTRGWSREWTGRGAFFGEFNATDNGFSKGGAEPGPTIETVLGDIETVGFDLDDGGPDTYGDEKRQCLGFTVAWDESRNFGTRLHNKVLHVFACPHSGSMAKWRLERILKGLSIEGEFDALIEE